MSVARAAYTALLLALRPAYRARLWWRGRDEPLYRFAVRERFGRYEGASPPPGALWIHAVSLGETRAAAALVDALRAARPGLRLLLTHGTATGRAAGAELLARDAAGATGDMQAWLPYDTPHAVASFFDRFRPALGVLMETELWPNLLAEADRRDIPMVLANARLSEKSAAKGRRLDALLRPAAQALDQVLAQTQADAARLSERGARRVDVCGNLKFDLTPDDAMVRAGRLWRLDGGRPIVLAASTREGEEAMLLDAWQAVPAPRPRLLIVPRHPQRFDEVAARVSKAGFALWRRSAATSQPVAVETIVPVPVPALEADVWLGDSLGEMPLYYGMADVALLGGSFAPLGGQNLIEAAACGCPVLMGPHTFNFAEAAELALAEGAASRVDDMAQGVAESIALAASSNREAMAQAALRFAAAHRGAARRMAERILESMPDR